MWSGRPPGTPRTSLQAQRISSAAGSLSGSLRMFLGREALLDDLRYDELVGGRDVTACED
jgi:hypothetical protein